MKPRSRDETKRETRDALLRAGMALIAKEGVDGPSLDAISARAGYTRGAFYVHFADRDEFLVAVMDEVGRELLDRLFGPDGDADLATIAARFAEAIATKRYPLSVAGGVPFHELLRACARSKRIRDRYLALVEESTDRLATAVRKSQTEGLIADHLDADAIAGLLFASVLGTQTLLELGAPVDVAAAGAALLPLLGVHAGKRRRVG